MGLVGIFLEFFAAENSGQLHRSVVVAMVAMGMVQPSIHEVIDMIPVGHAFVSAGRVVRV